MRPWRGPAYYPRTGRAPWRYSDAGEVPTSREPGRVVWSNGSWEPRPLGLAPTEARFEGLRFPTVATLRFLIMACIGERTEGMAGKRETAHLAFKERRAGVSEWTAILSEVAGHRLDSETARLLFDDDGTSTCRTTKEERVDARSVEQ